LTDNQQLDKTCALFNKEPKLPQRSHIWEQQ